MAERSPSPEYTTTFRLGLASFKPVAKGIARPCVVWNESRFTYPATRPVQPMPETRASDCKSIFDSISARANEFTVVPMPHPGHQICGMRSLRRNCSTGLTTSLFKMFGSKLSLIGWPPRLLSKCLAGYELRRRRAIQRMSWLDQRQRALLLAPSVQD